MMKQRDPERVLEELLVLRAQDGDQAAWRELALTWNSRLFAHAVTLLGDRDAAQDAVQDAWEAAFRGIRRLEDPARFRAWLLRIVSNKCADFIRRAQRRRMVDRDLAAEAAPSVEPNVFPEGDDDITALRRGLRRLPPDRRALLTMLYLRSMSVAEISAVLDVPPGTVKSRLHHAREHLRKILNRTSRRTT